MKERALHDYGWHHIRRHRCKGILLRNHHAMGAAMAESFRDLLVWHRAVQLSVAVYQLTATFPKSEQFGLTNQMRRAGVSIASNLAEGTGRSTTGEFLLFIGHARGSICELQTQMQISAALGFGAEAERAHVDRLAAETSRMLNAMFRKLREAKVSAGTRNRR